MITQHYIMAKAMQLVSERVSLPTWALKGSDTQKKYNYMNTEN